MLIFAGYGPPGGYPGQYPPGYGPPAGYAPMQAAAYGQQPAAAQPQQAAQQAAAYAATAQQQAYAQPEQPPLPQDMSAPPLPPKDEKVQSEYERFMSEIGIPR